MDFSTMTKEEALEYLAKPSVKNEYIGGFVDEDGVRMYECLVAGIEEDVIKPSQLPEYGVE